MGVLNEADLSWDGLFVASNGQGSLLITVNLMNSHGDLGYSKQQAPNRGVLNEPAHCAMICSKDQMQDKGAYS